MTRIEIEIDHVSQALTDGVGAAWRDLQAALGGGAATAILETPERRRSHPPHTDPVPHAEAPVADEAALRGAFGALLGHWSGAIETLMNRRWDLIDNPYAKAWILPGMILLHEDPLSWQIDAHAAEIAAGEALDDPHWALLMPVPASQNARLAAAAPLEIPHPGLLSAALDAAAREAGQALGALSWSAKGPAIAIEA